MEDLLMVLVLLVLRFFYHALPSKRGHDSLLQATKKDYISLYIYVKKIILSNTKIVKAVLVILAILLILPQIPYKAGIIYVIADALALLMYLLLVIVFAPKENVAQKGFPVGIFGFTYAVVLMFYSAGALVFDIFYANDFFREYMWIYGYSVTLISYVVCISTLKGFMERKLSNEEVVLLGMIMLTTLEFITYYGIGFFSGMEYFNFEEYADCEFFENITLVVNHGIYVASQSQILERSSMEIWGNIILNGTDVLTVTAVLGYVMQKFIEK